jgi:hypothetical protein
MLMRANALIHAAYGRILANGGSADEYVEKIREAKAIADEGNDPSVQITLKAIRTNIVGPPIPRLAFESSARLFGVAGLLAEEIDCDPGCHGDCSYHRPAADLFTGEPEIVERHIPKHDCDVACHADCVGYRHYDKPFFHVANPCGPPDE